MNAFLKENITLVAAIVLPALLAVMFFISSAVVSATVAPPKNDFLLVTEYYENNTGYRFNVENERLVISWVPATMRDANDKIIEYTSTPKLWRVHVPDMTVEKIALPEKPGANFSIAGITDIKVLDSMPGPDGYAFDNTAYNGGNLMTEVFGGRTNNYDAAHIENNGRAFKFTIPNARYSAYDSQFIGWIAGE